MSEDLNLDEKIPEEIIPTEKPEISDEEISNDILSQFNQVRLEKWKLRRIHRCKMRELDYNMIRDIKTDNQAKAYIHAKNTESAKLLIKIVGFIIAGLLSPSLAIAFVQNMLV